MDDETANAVECLINLLYLIRLRASSQPEVLQFVEMAEGPMATLIAAAKRGRRGDGEAGATETSA